MKTWEYKIINVRSENYSMDPRRAEELNRLSDPRLEMVTVTGAEASTDLAYATIYYSALDGAGHEQTEAQATATAAALHKATPHLRRVMGRQVRWRNTPFLTFKLDPSVAAGQRIEELLRDIHSREAEDQA